MRVLVKDSPYGGKYAVYEDGHRAPLPAWARPDRETEALIEALRESRLREDERLHREYLAQHGGTFPTDRSRFPTCAERWAKVRAEPN